LLQMPGKGDVVATVVRTTPISFALAFAGTIVLSMAGDAGDDDAGDKDGEHPSGALQDINPRRLM
jgi:hypothetical protein